MVRWARRSSGQANLGSSLSTDFSASPFYRTGELPCSGLLEDKGKRIKLMGKSWSFVVDPNDWDCVRGGTAFGDASANSCVNLNRSKSRPPELEMPIRHLKSGFFS